MRVLFSILLLAFLSGCADDPRDSVNATPSAQSDIIPRDKFVEVMSDIQLIEAASKNKVFRNDDETLRLKEAYSEIFTKHGITQEQFTESHKWWWTHPNAMRSILLEVTEKLSQLESEDDK